MEILEARIFYSLHSNTYLPEKANIQKTPYLYQVQSYPMEAVIFPQTTAIGALPYYITHTKSKRFQPMNINFGIIKDLGGPRIRDKKKRYEKIAERSLKDLQQFLTV